MKLGRFLSLCILSLTLFLTVPGIGQDLPADASEPVSADSISPPTDVIAVNHKYDNGGAIDVAWTPSPDDTGKILGYIIYRSREGRPADSVGFAIAGTAAFRDEKAENGVPYKYSVAALSLTGTQSVSGPSIPARATWEFFDVDKWNILLWMIVVCSAVIGFIISARAGRKLYIRKIAGLEALEEAVGRATEMGRPILYIPGILDMDDVQTLASITILSRVSRIVADYDSKIRMPVSRSLVMTTARETIREAYTAAGRPDAYNEDTVHYVTDEQFGYVAAVNGIMVREKPATCLYLGAFFAESLILAETGNSIGAIQIAGTARPGQLPFFVAACDYTLIGEELFAASAYLSGDPKQLGSLKGQDVGKFVAMVGIIVGALAMTLTSAWNLSWARWLLENISAFFSPK